MIVFDLIVMIKPQFQSREKRWFSEEKNSSSGGNFSSQTDKSEKSLTSKEYAKKDVILTIVLINIKKRILHKTERKIK